MRHNWHATILTALQHCNVFKKFLDFHNSEVTSKWLRRVKLTSPWPTPSAWNFAKHWPPRARLSTSPWTWAPTSPSPWTPGARRWHLNLCWERKEAPQHRGEMPSAEWNSSTERGKPLLPLWTPQWKRLLAPHSPVNIVITQTLPKGDWGNTKGWSMENQIWWPRYNPLLHPPRKVWGSL